jgi:CBS domain-containing protein
MAATATDIEPRLADLSDSAFNAFCEDIGAMFDADVQCKRQQAGAGTVGDVRKLFKKLTAVHLVQASGALDGVFQLFFDQGGLFVLSGVIVMLPQNKILDVVKRGTDEDANNLTDAAREVGNLLVGSWDRAFREECEGHEHFLKTSTFIGKPWEDSTQISLTGEEQVHFAVYEMTVASYPSFCCAAVFPARVVHASGNGDASSAEAPAAAPPAPSQGAPSAPAAAAPPALPAQGESKAPAQEAVPPAAPSVASAPASTAGATAEKPQTPAQSGSSEPPTAVHAREARTEAPVETKVSAPASGEAVRAAIPEDIQSVVEAVVGPSVPPAPPKVPPRPRVAAEPAPQSGSLLDQVLADYTVEPDISALTDLLNKPASQIMTPEVIWCDPETTVQDVIGLMQQHSVGYVLVGRDGALEGLLSNSSIQSAVSPYLRPAFAKWRRPEDDATLGIKVKWIMSRPVRTVRPETALATIIESMCRYGGRCLPVVDAQSKVQGIITVFDILLRVLEADQSLSWKGKPPQAVPVLV